MHNVTGSPKKDMGDVFAFRLLVVGQCVMIRGDATVGVQAAVATELDSIQQIDYPVDRIQEPYQQLQDGRD